MKVTIDWLKKYVDFTFDAEELARQLTMIGFEVENIKKMSYNFSYVVVGQILNINQHDGSDHLSICEVNVGNQVLSLVCGAPNVRKDLKVPIALVGASLSNGQIIKNANVHGFDSPGMICSEQELGLSQRGDTIMELDSSCEVGRDIIHYLFPEEIVLELCIAPNRPDCLGVIGIAREIAAINHSKLRIPEIELTEDENIQVNDVVNVDVLSKQNCPRYSARFITGVKIGSSPRWLVQKLEAIGLRSINNVVDITNFVMMETGQPLHAFNNDLIAGGKVIVKNAANHQKFITLDEKEHELQDDILMICDAQKSIALAGIMGGLNSEVTTDTTDILLESAYFNPPNIRKSSKYLGISTDSSQRFERGVDPNGTIYALNRAAQLIQQLAGGKIAAGYVDIKNQNFINNKINLKVDKVNNILGSDLSRELIVDILKSLELHTTVNLNSIAVTIPTFRSDLKIEEDLIEEIARIHGYDNIRECAHSKISLHQEQNRNEEFLKLVCDNSIILGYDEVITNTLINKNNASHFCSNNPIEVKNPLNDDLTALRTSLIPCLLQVAKWNLNRKNSNLKLFEVGNVFEWSKNNSHIEQKKVSLLITGDSHEETWMEKPRPLSFFDLKGNVESLLNRLNITSFYIKEVQFPFFDHRSLVLEHDNETIGFFGSLNQKILTNFDIKVDIYAAELDFQLLFKHRTWNQHYIPIPKFPEIRRDISLVVSEEIPMAQIETFISKYGNEYLKRIKLFDLYTGKQIQSDKKSLSFSLIYFSEKRTLTEKEIDENVLQIINALTNNFDVQLRK